MDVFSAVVTLFLIMDPLGNIPPFLSILKTVPAKRRRIVLVREILFAYGVLLVFLSSAAIFCGSCVSNRKHSASPAASCCS